jgi:hypothetical protein
MNLRKICARYFAFEFTIFEVVVIFAAGSPSVSSASFANLSGTESAVGDAVFQITTYFVELQVLKIVFRVLSREFKKVRPQIAAS